MAAQIVGQLFVDKFNRIGHEYFLHLQGERNLGVKHLICTRIYHAAAGEVTDSGIMLLVVSCDEIIQA